MTETTADLAVIQGNTRRTILLMLYVRNDAEDERARAIAQRIHCPSRATELLRNIAAYSVSQDTPHNATHVPN